MKKFVGRKLRCQNLKQKQIGVDHGFAEVALDVRHCLAFDLKAVSDPKAAHDLVKRRLKERKNKIEVWSFTEREKPLCCSSLNIFK